MKYIRTKNDIVDFPKWCEIQKEFCSPKLYRHNKNRLLKAVIKKSDNLKDLFDEYIIVAVDKDKPFLYALNIPVDSPLFDNEEETVYGAIWVFDENKKPTLKPVAILRNGTFKLTWIC